LPVSPRPTLGHIRRPQILQAAIETMYARGFAETRISDIAERAGTSSATVLYYFESKDVLLEEALGDSDERFYAALKEEMAALDSPSARLVHLIESCTAPAQALDDWTLWIEMGLQARHRPHMRPTYEGLERRLRALIADVVREGQCAGEFGPADADDVATALSAMLDGLGVQVTLEHPDVTPERMVHLCLTTASLQLGRELRPTATTGTANGRPA
jgi:AcrR family transcriptional regulator